MSKIQSAIERALEKTRGTRPTGPKERESPRQSATQKSASGIFRKFQFANPDAETMEESRIVSAVDDRAAKSAYNVLRTRVLQRMRSNGWSSILVTSPSPGDGKTLTAANLAMTISRDVNQSAILVDLDLTRSSVAKYLGISVEVKAGVGDYLLENADLSDITYTPADIDRLTIVPNREPVENSSDLLASPRMRDLVSLLREKSEKTVVIYDMPPVLACDDVLAFCPNVDAILLVVAQGKTERTTLNKTIAMLTENEILGIVLNMSDELSGNSSYAYY